LGFVSRNAKPTLIEIKHCCLAPASAPPAIASDGVTPHDAAIPVAASPAKAGDPVRRGFSVQS
jgi:hypothetical protein